METFLIYCIHMFLKKCARRSSLSISLFGYPTFSATLLYSDEVFLASQSEANLKLVLSVGYFSLQPSPAIQVDVNLELGQSEI